jgi:hypothetical protein
MTTGKSSMAARSVHLAERDNYTAPRFLRVPQVRFLNLGLGPSLRRATKA